MAFFHVGTNWSLARGNLLCCVDLDLMRLDQNLILALDNLFLTLVRLFVAALRSL